MNLALILEMAQLGASVAKSVHSHFKDRDIEQALRDVASVQAELEAAGTNEAEIDALADKFKAENKSKKKAGKKNAPE